MQQAGGGDSDARCNAVCKYMLSLVLKLQANILFELDDSADDATAAVHVSSSESRARRRGERLVKLSTATQLMRDLVACHDGADANVYSEPYRGYSGTFHGPHDVIPSRKKCCETIADLLRQQERYEEADEWWEDSGEQESEAEVDAMDEEQDDPAVST